MKSQIRVTDTGVFARFGDAGIDVPQVDALVREHLVSDHLSFPHQFERMWLFPGSQPGRHLVTEVFRRDLNAIRIKPYESRKTSMFHLAANMPSPLLGGLLGITETNAATAASRHVAGRRTSTWLFRFQSALTRFDSCPEWSRQRST